jgi:hypothetical protein
LWRNEKRRRTYIKRDPIVLSYPLFHEIAAVRSVYQAVNWAINQKWQINNSSLLLGCL